MLNLDCCNHDLSGLLCNSRLSGLLCNSYLSGLLCNSRLSSLLCNSRFSGLLYNSRLSVLRCNSYLSGLLRNSRLIGLFCNSRLSGPPMFYDEASIFQSTEVRIICRASTIDHVTPLCSVHWSLATVFTGYLALVFISYLATVFTGYLVIFAGYLATIFTGHLFTVEYTTKSLTFVMLHYLVWPKYLSDLMHVNTSSRSVHSLSDTCISNSLK